MFRKLSAAIVMLLVTLSLSAFARPFAAAEEGNPWWIWLLILLALVLFVAFALWWWMRSHEEDDEEEDDYHVRAEPAVELVAAVEPEEVEVKVPVEPDDLKRIEGIGPKISSVLQAAGVVTFAQLAETDVERLKQILEEENPNLLRLANPATWPEQAGHAAAGDWAALETLQDELKGGKRA